jgi:hypothetical protein
MLPIGFVKLGIANLRPVERVDFVLAADLERAGARASYDMF